VTVKDLSGWSSQTEVNQAFLDRGGCARRVICLPRKVGHQARRYQARFQLDRSAVGVQPVGVGLRGFDGLGCPAWVALRVLVGLEGLLEQGAADVCDLGFVFCHNVFPLDFRPPVGYNRGEERRRVFRPSLVWWFLLGVLQNALDSIQGVFYFLNAFGFLCYNSDCFDQCACF
jgi:hypothetical protein